MSVTRRTMLAATPAVAAAATMTNQAFAQNQPTAPGQPSAPMASQQAPGFYRYKIGDIEVTAINDGFARRPLENFVRNAELADVKKVLQEAFLPQDLLPISYTTLVLNTGGRLVLIDTGNGDSGPPTSGTWMANFRAAGFDRRASIRSSSATSTAITSTAFGARTARPCSRTPRSWSRPPNGVSGWTTPRWPRRRRE